jgi:lipopolysaccharide biosynthesis glycosyltransferase
VPVITADSPRPYRQLNSGTVVLNPSKALMDSLVEFMHKDADVSRWAFADQDVLADHFAGRWKPLHWYYNSLITLIHAHDHMWDESHVRCVHYIGKQKPWRARKSADVEHQSQRDWWWATYDAFEKELEQRDPETAKLMKQGVAS